ncbi:GntR family transcriptional regulator [Streptomyces sp. H10-C2]|uniref:GntR family transcriptional regulator n=1 Tax=unclassified Streptomyces TaxID=2593676 RepID=UPI0024B968AF|nr:MULTISPECIES: GntR family transcriptional regulator [unclassified Streptomyces]MDJ0344333.1 GntR family transcriptional regulator [Streptomyces sp. PH10-H1]MDJ0373702.1 GntR family transcriptional regulator [Streptomyces sp. H10-C2]
MSDQPPYLRVADAIRAKLASGEWSVGERLPSRAQLAQELQVGDNVVRRAQERLIIEGLLEGRAGSGTYVRRPRERLRMVRSRHRERRGGSPFRADMKEQGRTGSWESRSTARAPAPANIAERLAIAPGDLTVHTRYEFLGDGQPVQLSQSWEPMAITDGTPVVLPEMGPFAGAGVVERMRTIGVIIETAVEIPRPSRATQEQAKLLGISVGDMVMEIERTYYDTDGRPVETADITVPDIRWEIAYEIPVEQP